MKNEMEPQGMYGQALEDEDVLAFPMSAGQQRMWFFEQYEQNTAVYNLVSAYHINGAIRADVLEESFQTLMARHESLRTVFQDVAGELLQLIYPRLPFKLERIEIQEAEGELNQSAKVKKLIEDLSCQPFDLSNGPLIRAYFMSRAGNENILLINMHHIIFDGWSMNVFNRELMMIYDSIRNGKSIELAELPIQYADYAEWQQEWLEGLEAEKQLEYWKRQLDSDMEPLNLPTDYPRHKNQTYHGQHDKFVLPAESLEKIESLKHQAGVSSFVVLYSVFVSLLYRYSGQKEIYVGTPVSGRQDYNTKDVIGFFVNTVVLRSEMSDQLTFAQLLKQTQQMTLEALNHQDYPLDQLVEAIQPRRTQNISPFFQVMFSVQDLTVQELKFGEVPAIRLDVDKQTAKYDLTFMINQETDGGTGCIVEYNTDLFTPETIQRMKRHFIQIIEAVGEHPELPLAKIQILTEEERLTLLKDFNQTERDYPRDKTIKDWFEEQVEQTPDLEAVVLDEQSLTYAELNERANRLARTLRDQGVRADQLVALMVEPSVELVVGVLGILKAGGAYLPIDPDYPAERIQYMLKDSGASLLLTQTHLKKPFLAREGIGFTGDILDLNEESVYVGDGSNMAGRSQASDLAYVIYTSGSTGQPKGVMIEQRNVIRLVKRSAYVQLNPGDRLLQTGAIVFDASTFELWGALLNGLTLYLLPKERLLQVEELRAVIQTHQITTLWLTASLFNHLSDECVEMFNGVKQLLVGGEKLSPKHINQLKKANPHIRIINGYGPTESTTFTTTHLIDKLYETNIPIGKPITNTSVYIVDSHHQLQPIGVVGELCVGGDGLARGYLNLPDLTEEKFVPNPFVPGERMYKTGDLARWLPDGNIEYIGRMDDQVKIRGYRIELGDIESQLLKHERIKEAVVIAYEQEGGKQLCAYVVAEEELSAIELREYLSERLPEYMIPVYYAQVEQMPLTPNGKVDKRALPEPDLLQTGKYEAPRTALEMKLADLWQTHLGIERAGLHDHFFELGGHSLKAMMLVSKIRKELGVEIPLKLFFEQPTIKGLASYIEENGSREVYSALKPVEGQEYYPVSSTQKRMYILNQFEGSAQSYNMPQGMLLEGSLNTDRLHQALEKLMARHEILRTSFDLREGEVVQRIDESVACALEYIEAEQAEMGAMLEQWVRPFDLKQAPLWRAGIVKLAEEKHILLLDIHHIISDGVSMNLMFQEIQALYEGTPLPALAVQYKEYAVWQQNWLNSDAFQQDKYWLQKLAGRLPVLELPADFVRPAVKTYAGERLTFRADNQLTAALKRLASQTGSTLYMLLFATYNTLLYKYSGQEDIIVGSPIAGRTHPQTHDMLGMFVNTLALRSFPQGEKSFGAFLEEVKKEMVQAFEHQDYPFEVLVERLGLQHDASRSHLFDTMFVLQSTERFTGQIGDVQISTFELPYKIAKFDLTLSAIEDKEEILFSAEYNTDLFQKETIERLGRHYLQILQAVVENPEQRLCEIPMLSAAEQQHLLAAFNPEPVRIPEDKSIKDWFEEQVEQTPDLEAVVLDEQSLTYAELNERANRLARTLCDQGVRTDQLVALMAEPSVELVVGVLGILKAGGAYLPIDPDYPAERIQYMLEDSGASLLLTQTHLKKPFLAREGIGFTGDILDLNEESVYAGDGSNMEGRSQASDLAYVIYTSGSTGQPKGVMVEQRNVIRLVKQSTYVQLNPGDRLLQTGAIVFDASTFELWGALLNGLTLYLLPKERLLQAEELGEVIRTHQITTLWLTASLFNHLSDECVEMFNGVKQLLVGGEKLSPKHINQLKKANPHIRIINGYGPTESTTFTTTHLIDKLYETNIPIGKPITNTSVYIVDSHHQLQPIGVVGELCVGGDGLARGYLNLPELTEEKFVPNPFVPGERMYKTGDLARWLPDGNIEYIGRMDDQVKIRGYRIELGDIESQLLKHERIKEAVVIAYEQEGSKQLCAYVVAEEELSATELREYLSERLPEYMIPVYYAQVEQMPLTPNGKVDKRALPPLDKLTMQTGREYQGPRNEVEQELVEIWSEVLGLDKDSISINDDILALGGDSLKIIKMYSRTLSKGWNIRINDYFEQRTIERLAKLACHEKTAEETVNTEDSVQDFKPLPRLQNRIKFTDGAAVLLTGVTGYLGAHLLAELIQQTSSDIYCLVRGDHAQQAEAKVYELLAYYFKNQNEVYTDLLRNSRLQVICGDLTKANFGLNEAEYSYLQEKIQTVIHAAALTKHYGEYREFENANINGTREIIRFCGTTKSLHYISTMSVGGKTHQSKESISFTEKDFYIGQNYQDNVYVKSKFLAETFIYEAVEKGLDAAVYRIGNLTGRYMDGLFQRNIEENAFYRMIRSLLYIGKFPDHLLEEHVEFTPVDLCSKAIIAVIKERGNKANELVYHVYNHKTVKFAEILHASKRYGSEIQVIEQQSFQDYVYALSQDPLRIGDIEGLAPILEQSAGEKQGRVNYSSQKTIQNLKELRFEWPAIDKAYLEKVMQYMIGTGFISLK